MRLAAVALFLASALSFAQTSVSVDAYPEDGHVHEPLWKGKAPGAMGTESADIPTLTVYLPKNNPTKTGVVIAPGGGYVHLALDHEGVQVAAWLNAHGIAAFVLKYRISPYHHPIELGDAQRALRTVRSRASEFGIEKNKIGMWGFSAGGHLTATAGTHFDAGNPSATDVIERESSRPDFLVLAYPVITFTAVSAHTGSVKGLLGPDSDPALIENLSAEKQVTPQTPPTFLFATTDDQTVPVMNSVMFYTALVQNKVPAEMHLFRHGRHGVGLAQANTDLKQWPDLLLHWLAANGWATLP